MNACVRDDLCVKLLNKTNICGKQRAARNQPALYLIHSVCPCIYSMYTVFLCLHLPSCVFTLHALCAHGMFVRVCAVYMMWLALLPAQLEQICQSGMPLLSLAAINMLASPIEVQVCLPVCLSVCLSVCHWPFKATT